MTVALSAAERKALEILANLKPDYYGRQEVYPAEFARRMWPDSPGWHRWSHGRKTALAVGIKRAGGAFLSKLTTKGLVSIRFNEHSQSFYSITTAGREALNQKEN